MQPMAFRTNRGINALADCSDTTIIPALDLEVFREAWRTKLSIVDLYIDLNHLQTGIKIQNNA